MNANLPILSKSLCATLTHTHTYIPEAFSKCIIYSYYFRIKFPVLIQFTEWSNRIFSIDTIQLKKRWIAHENVCFWCHNNFRHAHRTTHTTYSTLDALDLICIFVTKVHSFHAVELNIMWWWWLYIDFEWELTSSVSCDLFPLSLHL